MTLEDLIKPLRDMTDEELLARIRERRHNRNRAKPAAATKARKEVQRTSVNKLTAISKKVDTMTTDEKARLLAQLAADLGE